MAYEIQPFRLLDANATNATGYEGGMGNPNDYEYYVDPATRTVKRRAKQGLASFAGLTPSAPTGSGSGGFEQAPSSGGAGYGTGRGEGPSLGAQQAALNAMSIGGKMSQVPGLIGLLGYGVQALGRGAADQQLGYIGDNLGLLDSGPVADTGMYTVSDQSGNVFNVSNAQSIQDQNVANFGISGFDTSLGGYTGMSTENNNAGTSGSPLGGSEWGGGGYSGGGYDGSAVGGGYSDGSDGGYW